MTETLLLPVYRIPRGLSNHVHPIDESGFSSAPTAVDLEAIERVGRTYRDSTNAVPQVSLKRMIAGRETVSGGVCSFCSES
jgi:hypothetical protein